MQAELAYYGKFTELSYFDSLPWGHFLFYHSWLRDTKKKEAEEQKKQKMAQDAAMSSAKAKSRRPSRPPPRSR